MERRRWHGACAEDADCGDGSCPSAALFATPLTSAKAGSDTPRDADRPMYPIRRSDPSRECAPPRVSYACARAPAMPFVQRPCDMRDQVQF